MMRSGVEDSLIWMHTQIFVSFIWNRWKCKAIWNTTGQKKKKKSAFLSKTNPEVPNTTFQGSLCIAEWGGHCAVHSVLTQPDFCLM